MSAQTIDLPSGVIHVPLLSARAQAAMLDAIRAAVGGAPFFQPVMPRTGRPFSVRMTNFGALGWVSDRAGGYRYQAHHPVGGQPWPAIPDPVMAIWEQEDLAAPVVSISLGDTARFRIGGLTRGGPARSIKLVSGDVVVLGGDSRLRYHGVDRIYAGTSGLLRDWPDAGGRLNLTLRRVTLAEETSA
ncbi:MAG: alpha-ketoglutarate-dependent dioxygenase AlkB family protein [Alphaproteobacteria bacterium]